MGDAQPRTLNVLLTGFGPFTVRRGQADIDNANSVPVNPSSELIRLLPQSVTLPSGTTAALTRVPDLHVSYEGLKDDVARLYAQKEWDLVVHCGAASRRPQICVELLARREGYTLPDTDGNYAASSEVYAAGTQGAEESFRTALDGEALVAHLDSKGWAGKVRASDNAGLYLCEWTYYAGLRQAALQARGTKVLFLHVPVEGGELLWTHKAMSECVEEIVRWCAGQV
ncbi:peptidase C15, pyroglutamyl peptidase I-like protein [Calocera cornea HHB12733]|uniref:Peptidase C15, pyroglutamyl peptidase I-like protein n=1 Tax=Calocera cornea HHB12733 TaxID=1353952 RepID=A0A165HFW1_9BASI|nr:peptidase C15, pyroglutamyl peptidase I-like protein [Calocera cornea HHB12733]